MPLFQCWGLSCNACGEQFHTVYATAVGVKNEALANGWYVGDDGTTLCPDCDGENE